MKYKTAVGLCGLLAWSSTVKADYYWFEEPPPNPFYREVSEPPPPQYPQYEAYPQQPQQQQQQEEYRQPQSQPQQQQQAGEGYVLREGRGLKKKGRRYQQQSE